MLFQAQLQRELLEKETPAQKRFRTYLEHGANDCPWCQSHNIGANHVIVSEDYGRAQQKVQCYECGKVWFDNYKLIDIEEVTDELEESNGSQPLDKEAVRLKV